MNNYAIVRQEHLNHYGFLFGGALLQWVDEYAWLVASLDFPGCPLVTVGMDQISFRRPVANGSILRFNIQPIKRGKSSVQYTVDVDTMLDVGQHFTQSPNEVLKIEPALEALNKFPEELGTIDALLADTV